jgi:hypothetical protein
MLKRLVLLPMMAALLHSALWAGIVYQMRANDFAQMEACRARVMSVSLERRYRLSEIYLRLRLEDTANAPVVELSSGYTRDKLYAFSQYRRGQVITAWKARGSNHVSTVLQPEAAEFAPILGWFLLTVGAATAFAVFFVQGMRRKPRPLNNGTLPAPSTD